MRARTSPPPAGSSPRTGPRPSTCSASRASSSSTPSTTGGCTTGARRRPRPGLRRRPGPQPRHGRVLLGRPPAAAHLLRAAGRLRPVRGDGRRGHRAGCGRAARRLGLPARPLAEPRRPRPGVGAGRRRPASRSCSTSAAPATSSTRTTSQRPAGPARLPRRRGELPLGRLHGHPRAAGADARHDDLRRRARAVPRAPHRRDRAGGDLGAVLDPPDGVGLRGVRTGTRSGCSALSLRPTRVRAPPGALHALPHRGRRVDHRAGRARHLHVLVGLSPTSRAAEPDRALRGVAGRRR